MDEALVDVARGLPPDSPGLLRAIEVVRGARNVRFAGGCFRIDGTVASGLLGRLQKATGWSSADPRARGYRETRRRRVGMARARRSCPTWGERHGTRVHEEVAAACDAISKLRVVAKKRGRDPCTERVLKFLRKRGWAPVAAELPVGARGLATAVDLLAVSATTGELIAIEIKTGYENEKYEPKRGDAPLPLGFRDCPRHRHELQLASTCLLMPRPPHRAYIVKPASKAHGVDWLEVRWWQKPHARAQLLKLLYGQ
jgi:hypothetical protein